MALLLTLVPTIAGLLLVIGAVFGLIVWRSLVDQVVLGGLITMASFAVSNIVQKAWILAAGWLLLGLALWLAPNWPESWGRILALVLAGLGSLLLVNEFLKRWQQQQGEARKR